MRELLNNVKQGVFTALPSSRFLRRGPSAGRRLALTFDDGPNERTMDYLRTLDQLDVPATFFIMGDLCEHYPHLVREYTVRGHQIAGHGHDHTRFTELSPTRLHGQLTRTTAVLGPQPEGKWVRPPHGALGPASLAQLLATGWTVAMWSFDGKDYELTSADALVAHCAPANLVAGDVILLHEGQQWTIDALPRIVEAARRDGFTFVTMADLFAR